MIKCKNTKMLVDFNTIIDKHGNNPVNELLDYLHKYMDYMSKHEQNMVQGYKIDYDLCGYLVVSWIDLNDNIDVYARKIEWR